MERLNHSELQKRQDVYNSLTQTDVVSLGKVAALVAATETAAKLGHLQGSRRNFFRLSAGVAATAACAVSAPIPKTSRVTFINEDIFEGFETGGNVIVNGTRIKSGDSLTIDNGIISSIDIEVDGYNSAYLIGLEGNDTIYMRDKDGHHGTTVSEDITLKVRSIPKWFDTVSFARSMGNYAGPVEDADFIGDGTIQNYGKRDIDVCISEAGQIPTISIINKTKTSIAMINQAAQKYVLDKDNKGIIHLNYIGMRDSYLSDGITHLINDSPPMHNEVISGNKIEKSYLRTKNDDGSKENYVPQTALLEEMLQSTGIRNDGKTDHCIYVALSDLGDGLINNAAEAIYLNNQLPQGFLLDTASNPTVVANVLFDARTGSFSDNDIGGSGRRSSTGYTGRGLRGKSSNHSSGRGKLKK